MKDMVAYCGLDCEKCDAYQLPGLPCCGDKNRIL